PARPLHPRPPVPRARWPAVAHPGASIRPTLWPRRPSTPEQPRHDPGAATCRAGTARSPHRLQLQESGNPFQNDLLTSPLLSLRSLRTAAWYQYRLVLANREINRRSPVPSIQVNERGCAGGRKRAPRTAAVTTREPKQRVWRAVAAEEVQAVMRAAALFPANLHFAVKER